MIFEEDPRAYIIPSRLEQVSFVLPVMSYKGGVGKTTISTLLSLALAEKGLSVGLLDLDFTNPSVHRTMGIDLHSLSLKEERGVWPIELEKIKIMSIAFFTKDNPLPLRGIELDNIFKELLSITIWGKLDFLIIDMPPGLTDLSLDLFKYLKNKIRPLLVSSSSILSITPSINLIKILKELEISPIGIIINLGVGSADVYELIIKALQGKTVKVLGVLDEDKNLEKSYGNITMLKMTKTYLSMERIIEEMKKELIKK